MGGRFPVNYDQGITVYTSLDTQTWTNQTSNITSEKSVLVGWWVYTYTFNEFVNAKYIKFVSAGDSQGYLEIRETTVSEDKIVENAPMELTAIR